MATILVVDDEIGIRELISEILSDEGHVVLVAENAAQARLIKNREALDLVLLDIWMPDTDGVTLLKEWAAAGALSMPVIMMSGHATIDTAVEATRFGALDFLEKPVALQRLLHAVRNGLERGRLVRSLRAGGVQMATPPGLQHAPLSAHRPAGACDQGNTIPFSVASAADGPDPQGQVRFIGNTSAVAARAGALPAPTHAPQVQLDQPLRDARDHFERIYFEYHLLRENHSMTRVAERAGLERTHLYRKLKQLGVDLSRGGRRQGRASVDAAKTTAHADDIDALSADLPERASNF
ncbi:MAG TPA: response regulator [Burkholderiaceae bacterium]|nr:response regulator [Burkholderiaceae bacterium]